ncbi:MAG: Ig-like domain-containing protein, partial [Ferruginibacter sp.]
QAHYSTGLPADIVEGGQLLLLDNPYAANQQGPSTTQTSYLLPVANGVQFTAILSANDSIGGYPMVGVPDGLGAYDNNNGTFTLLMNQELGNTLGAVRAHGSKGSFVSKWIINKSDLKVLSGSDLMRNVNLWDPATATYTTFNAANPSARAAFGRFCSADLPATAAFYNAASGLGTQERIFMNGEESNDESRAMAHIATGPNTGTSWELPALGKGAWENSVASPASGDKTVVGLMNDGTDGQVYFYIGTKTNTGTEVDKAGLTNGTPWGVLVSGFAKERVNSTTLNPLPAPGTRFSLVDLGDVKNITGAAFNTNSNTAGITSFSRPEDGAWDPSHPNDFYFNTTDQFDQTNEGVGTQVGRSRVWRLRFDDINNPALGGTAEAVLDGTEGINMLDNMAIDKNGHMILNEDVGNQAHNGKVWQYDIATDALKLIAKHDPARFGDINILPTAPFNKDEETSGTIDVQDILGAGKFLIVDQAHYSTGLPADIVEGGQLLAMYNPYSLNTPPTVSITSPVNNAPVNAGAIVNIQATAADADGTITKVVFYNNGVQIGVDSTAPYTLPVQVEAATYVFTAVATDNAGDTASSNTVTIKVTGCNGSGYISASGYLNIPGSQVADLTASPKYPNSPDIVATLNSMEYSNVGDNYGGRLLGYICAPATGFYTFYIAGDDQAGVFLSTDENPANKVLIAYNESFVPFRGYYANATQKSAPIKLIKGVRYYIETLHKEKSSADHLSVAWELPNGSFEAPIPGNRLSPFGSYFPGRTTIDFVAAMENVTNKGALKVKATPNPTQSYFTIAISSKKNELVSMIVTDAAGRVVEKKQHVAANSTIQLGNRLPAGIYFVEIMQGNEKQRVKLVKQ